ncbi:MAG: DUF2399 domain-containing protein [Synechococcaceae cyanobacterium RL_1_2]|nr:DUF2399 domain-containing protein [Synechococcaceae cyanobacterium RL_1_2]
MGAPTFDLNFEISAPTQTYGPSCRYGAVLFIEKEGFQALLNAANIAQRYDLAIMSTKGMSVTACRSLVEKLAQENIAIFCLHDFDKSGFSILKTLGNNTNRYQFTTKPNIIDFGIRLGDINHWQLQSEPVIYSGKKDPRENLRKSGATDEEIDFLIKGQDHDGEWYGDRVEINALSSGDLIELIESKLEAMGLVK